MSHFAQLVVNVFKIQVLLHFRSRPEERTRPLPLAVSLFFYKNFIVALADWHSSPAKSALTLVTTLADSALVRFLA